MPRDVVHFFEHLSQHFVDLVLRRAPDRALRHVRWREPGRNRATSRWGSPGRESRRSARLGARQGRSRRSARRSARRSLLRRSRIFFATRPVKTEHPTPCEHSEHNEEAARRRACRIASGSCQPFARRDTPRHRRVRQPVTANQVLSWSSSCALSTARISPIMVARTFGSLSTVTARATQSSGTCLQ